jgi:hypothetical protein
MQLRTLGFIFPSSQDAVYTIWHTFTPFVRMKMNAKKGRKHLEEDSDLDNVRDSDWFKSFIEGL